MDAKLSEQIQALIDTVEEAETQMASLATAMSKSSGDVRPECQHIQDEIGRVLDELGYIRYIAVLREAEQATSHTPNKTLRD